MPQEIDKSNPPPSPQQMSDEQLDALLARAQWPHLSSAALGRLADSALPPGRANAVARRAWWLRGLAAAALLAVAALIWSLWPVPVPQPVSQRAPEVDDQVDTRAPETPRFHYAVLPGREATDAERAWAQIMRREDMQRQKQPGQRPRHEAPTLSEVVRSGGGANRGETAAAARPRPQQLLTTLLDPSADPSVRQETARAVPAVMLERALNDPALTSRAADLAAALVTCEDPAAAKVLLRLAERSPGLAHQAVAAAPVGSRGVLGLVGCLNDSLIPQRERAASLLAVSDDPAVLVALSRRLKAPEARRETLIALLSSASPDAQSIVTRAELDPGTAALVRSLRAQGYGSSRETSQLQMTVL